jgi:hypothetical protein
MKIEQLKSLNEDELAMLWYILNKIGRPVFTTHEFDPEVFTSIRHDSFIRRIVEAEPHVKEESKPLYDSLKQKLDIV